MTNKLILSIALFCSTNVFSATPFTPEQETRIKEMIRETLVENPSILVEAADSYNKQAAQLQNETVAQVTKQNYKDLYEDPASPRLGAKNSAITLVYFTDYNCVFCKKFEGEINRLMTEHPDVAVVIKPLPYRSETSLTAARLALTVWEKQPQNFLALHERLMAKKGYHDDASIAAALKKAKIAEIAPGQKSQDTVNLNLMLAQKLGVQGTPATLVGNTLISGAVPYEELERAVSEAKNNK